MTPDELEAIEQRCAAATEGPWVFYWDGKTKVRQGATADGTGEWICAWISDENGRFIAASRTDVPALVAEIKHARFLMRESRVFVAAHEPDPQHLTVSIDEALGGRRQSNQSSLHAEIRTLREALGSIKRQTETNGRPFGDVRNINATARAALAVPTAEDDQ